MNSIHLKVLCLPLAALLVCAVYGLVTLVDQLKSLHNTSWIMPIFLLVLMAFVPAILFFMTQASEEDTDQDDEAEKEFAD